jgi:hypothetical protein
MWLFIGYSMPEADFEFRQVLKSAELANRSGKAKNIQVILKKDKSAGLRYRKFFGLRAKAVNQGGLKKWVADKLGDWLDDTAAWEA